MDRREMLLGAGAIALAAATQTAFAEDHAHHHGGGAAKNQKLMDASTACVQKGQACLHHTLYLLGQGDKEMGACAISVNQMMAACAALEQLARYESKHLAKQAKVAMEICRDCEAECRKHAKKHNECKNCADACAACMNECKTLAV